MNGVVQMGVDKKMASIQKYDGFCSGHCNEILKH